MGYLFLCYDSVWYIDVYGQLVLDRNTLDETLSKVLIDRVRNNAMTELFVITGPGGFTNLRVGSLVCNLLMQYVPVLSCRTISKQDMYTYLVEQGFLPPYGIIYIGQKKTVWNYDFRQKTQTVTSKDQHQTIQSYFVDPIDGYFPEQYDKNRVSFVYQSNTLIAQYQGQTYSLAGLIQSLTPVSVVAPSYYVQPIIG